MEKLTFTIDGHGFSTDFNSGFSQDPNTDFNTEEEIIEEREKCVKEILEVTGRHCSWYKEITGNKNWILYDTEQYEVRNYDDIEYLVLNNKLMDAETFLCVRKDFKGKLHLPINASTCSFMFVDINVPKIDLTEFDTTNVVDMDYMFLEANLGDSLSLVSSTSTQINNTESSSTKANLGDSFSLVSSTNAQANTPDQNTLILNTEGVTTMSGMFKDCKVKHLDLRNLRTNNVTDFSNMFCSCNDLIDLSMFDNCKALERLNLPDVVLDDVVRSYAMFDDCDSLKEIYMEHPLNLEKYAHGLIFGNCKAEVKKSTE